MHALGSSHSTLPPTVSHTPSTPPSHRVTQSPPQLLRDVAEPGGARREAVGPAVVLQHDAVLEVGAIALHLGPPLGGEREEEEQQGQGEGAAVVLNAWSGIRRASSPRPIPPVTHRHSFCLRPPRAPPPTSALTPRHPPVSGRIPCPWSWGRCGCGCCGPTRGPAGGAP